VTVGYDSVCHEADKRGLRVKLGVGLDTSGKSRLSRLWVEDRGGDEVAAVHLPAKADLDEAGDLLLELLREQAA